MLRPELSSSLAYTDSAFVTTPVLMARTPLASKPDLVHISMAIVYRSETDSISVELKLSSKAVRFMIRLLCLISVAAASTITGLLR